jgi:hypothetical protein
MFRLSPIVIRLQRGGGNRVTQKINKRGSISTSTFLRPFKIFCDSTTQDAITEVGECVRASCGRVCVGVGGAGGITGGGGALQLASYNDMMTPCLTNRLCSSTSARTCMLSTSTFLRFILRVGPSIVGHPPPPQPTHPVSPQPASAHIPRCSALHASQPQPSMEPWPRDCADTVPMNPGRVLHIRPEPDCDTPALHLAWVQLVWNVGRSFLCQTV